MKRIGILAACLLAAQTAAALPPSVIPPPLVVAPGKIVVGGAAGMAAGDVPAVVPAGNLEGSLFYGQSNAGQGGTPGGWGAVNYTGANCPTAIMFAANSYVANTPVPASAMTGSASLQNVPYGTAVTPAIPAGCAVQQFYANNGLPSVPRWWGTTSYGGAALSSFLAGTSTFNNLIAQATAFASVRPDLQAANVIKDVVWIQGESGPYDSTYQGLLSTLIGSIQTGVQSATGQTAAPQLFIWQTNRAANDGTFAAVNAIIPMADLAVVGPGVSVLGPSYFSPLNTIDDIHDTPIGRMMMADIYALAYKRVVHDGLAWNPLQPISIARSGAVITVEYQLPPGGGNLAIDTTWVAATANYGFLYEDSNGIGTISSVTLGADGTSVVITLAATPTGTGRMLYYAMGPASAADNVTGWSADRGQIISPTTTQSVFYAQGYTVPQYINHYAVKSAETVP